MTTVRELLDEMESGRGKLETVAQFQRLGVLVKKSAECLLAQLADVSARLAEAGCDEAILAEAEGLARKVRGLAEAVTTEHGELVTWKSGQQVSTSQSGNSESN